MTGDIFEYVQVQKTEYEAGVGIPIAGSWMWKMYDHCNFTMLMKNSQFPLTQTKMGDRPKKNIILPILNVAYRTEGFDVKDIEPYVDDPDYYHLSLLIRKYHDTWARKFSIDTFIDDVVEGLDYGFVLVKNVNRERPEVVQPQQIAFCDQTDILSGALGLKYQYSVDQLLDTVTDLGWDEDAVNRAISGASDEKKNDQSQGQSQKTPSKYIEVYEVHGTFCDGWLMKDGQDDYNSTLDSSKYSKQLHVITYIKDQNDTKIGLTLFKGKEPISIFKLMVINPIYGRAAGFGRVESLFEAQIWTDFTMIHKMNMLREASKVVYLTTDKKFNTANNTTDVKSGQYLIKEPNTEVAQLNTTPVNITLFDNATQEWEQHARVTGSASDPALGIDPASGTPLGTTQIVTSQGEGIHDYIRGKVAVFMNEIYQDWVIDYLKKDMMKGNVWLSELSLEELQSVADRVAVNYSNETIKEKLLAGEIVTKEQQDAMHQAYTQQFMKSGNSQFLELLKGEIKDIPMKIKFNIAGKQKDLSKMVEKLTNIWRTILANPQGFAATMLIPGAAKSFNDMLEASGLSPISFDFGTMKSMVAQDTQIAEPPQDQTLIKSSIQQPQLNQPVAPTT